MVNATGDTNGFLEAMARAVAALPPAEARALACAIAERHLVELGDDEGGTRRMVAQARGADGPVPGAVLAGWLEELATIRANIDPDRTTANDRRRAAWVVARALEACAEGAAPTATFAAVEAALASRALRGPAHDEAERAAQRKELAARWSWDAVQAEATWLSDRVSRGSGGVRTPAPAAVLPAPAPAPARDRDELTPRALTFSVAGRTLRFVGVDGNTRFRAEVDGRRCLVRARFRFVEVSHAGSTDDDPPWTESTVVDLARLVAALDAGATPVVEPARTVVEHHEPGAHFRQNDDTRVVLALTPEGVVEVETARFSQDESYY